MIVSLAVSSPRPLVTLTLDLLGDGLPGVAIHGDDLRPVRGLGITAQRTGTFRLQSLATDAAGCSDTTGAARMVVVTR